MNGRRIPWARTCLLTIGGCLFVLPAAWMVATALKPVEQTMSLPPRWLPYAWEADVDGNVIEVGVGPSAAETGPPSYVVAFQWCVEIGGIEVPVQRVGDRSQALDGAVQVRLGKRTEALIDGRTQVVRRVPGRPDDRFVSVIAQGRDGLPVVRKLAPSALVERFNTTRA